MKLIQIVRAKKDSNGNSRMLYVIRQVVKQRTALILEVRDYCYGSGAKDLIGKAIMLDGITDITLAEYRDLKSFKLSDSRKHAIENRA